MPSGTLNWTAVCDAIRDLPRRSIWCAVNPVEVMNQHLFLLVERFVPTKVIRVRNKDNPWFNDDCRRASTSSRRLIVGGLVIALELTGMSFSITRGGVM